MNFNGEDSRIVYNNPISTLQKKERVTIFKGSSGANQTIYEDNTVLFSWDATNQQPQFQIKILPIGSWFDAGLSVVKLNTTTAVSETLVSNDDIASALGTYYFTNGGTLNVDYKMNTYASHSHCWLLAESTFLYPCYSLNFNTGNTAANLVVKIEKY
jgi:hypothetical protein